MYVILILKRQFRTRVTNHTLPILIKRHIRILRSEIHMINYSKIRSVFYSLYKTDKYEEFLQHHPSLLRSLLQFYKQIVPL